MKFMTSSRKLSGVDFCLLSVTFSKIVPSILRQFLQSGNFEQL